MQQLRDRMIRRNWEEEQGGQRCPFNLKDCLGEIANCQPRTQALCVVLWLARPLRGPRGLILSISSHACRPACVSRDGVAQQSAWVRGWRIVRNVSAILLRICFRKRKKCSHRASRIAQSPGGEPPIIQ